MRAVSGALIGAIAAMTVLFTASPRSASTELPETPRKTVWQLGHFDQSSAEFSDVVDTASCSNFVIETSKTKEWCAFHPGSANARFASAPRPRTIDFTMAAPPSGLYRLRFDLMVEHTGMPALEVDINGHRARFYQRPVLNHSMGDGAAAWFPTYSTANISFTFPASYLKLGKNQIELTAVDDRPAGPPTPDAPSWAGDSGIVYDAISLEHARPGDYTPDGVAAQVFPSIFYRRNEDGRLTEELEVLVRFDSPPKNAGFNLAINGQIISQPLETNGAFGEQRIALDVPEIAGPTPVKLTVTADGRGHEFNQVVQPAKKWTLFIVPNEHLDVGYTDFPAKVAEVHSRVIDEAMQLIERNPDFRFTLDGFWEVEQFEAGRTEAEIEHLHQMVSNRGITVPPQYASLLTQYAGAEALIRGLYAGDAFHRQFGGIGNYVGSTDIPSFSWSYASLIAGGGFKYFVSGSNDDASPILLFGRHHEHSPFWWEGPDGNRVLMWYSRMYTQVAALFGMPPDLALGVESLPVFLQTYDHAGYPSDAAIVYGTQPENTDLFPQQATFVADWNKRYAYPVLRYSSFPEALDYIVGSSQDRLPVVRGDGGSFWESFNTADARFAALERENEARALSAEKISTLSAVVDPAVVPDGSELRRVWKNLVLMDEHTWNSSRSVSQPRNRQTIEQQSEKEALATNGRQLIDRILERGMAVIADRVSAPPHSLVVFNSLNWKRSGLVEFDLDPDWEIIDETNQQPVAYEVRSTELTRRVRFLAEDVPELGYKVFRLRKSQPKREYSAATDRSLKMESPFYRVRLDPSTGSIRSIYDKDLQRELVDASSPFRFGQYVYVTGADTLPNRLVVYRTSSPYPKLTPFASANGRIISVARTPYGAVATLESSALNTPSILTEVVLFDRQKKIEITYKLTKREIFRKEGVYFAFPLALKAPDFRYEIQTTSIDPARDMLPGAGLETFSVQHWINATENGISATVFPIDAAMMALGDFVRGTFPTEFGRRSGRLFSFLMSNYHYDNWPGAQGGEFTFHYAFTSSSTVDASALTRLGWEEATPLEVNEVTTQDKAVDIPRPLPAAMSFAEIDRQDILLQTWKPAEDGNGTILRFLNFGGERETVNVSLPLMKLKSAWLCTVLEHNRSQLPLKDVQHISFEVRPHELVTVRLNAIAGSDR
jgi:alpha-mannosidase